MNKPLLSIIIPVYNVEKYLKRCLDSIINQTYKNLEIIIVNDASTDTSQEIINKYKEKDDRITSIINEKNINLGLTRNVGIENTNGKYIAFVDSDDWIENTMYEEMVNLGIENDSDIVECNLNIKNDHTNNVLIKNLIPFFKKVSPSISSYIIHLSKNELGVMTTNKIYKSKLIKNNHIKFEDNRIIFSEDLFFNLEIIRYTDSIITINKPFYNYFMRPNSLSHNNNFVNLDKLIVFIKKFISNNSNYNTFNDDFSAFSVIMMPFIKRTISSSILGSKNKKLDCSIFRNIRKDETILKIIKEYFKNKEALLKDRFLCFCILLKLDYIIIFLYLLKNKFLKIK